MTDGLSNDLFISYRRDVAGILAMALHQHLTAKGLNVFYDIESLRAGQFDSIILNQIAARPYFVLVLTPGTLERCGETDDWLRREIEQALATVRVIVPVHTPNFDFADLEQFLPSGLGREVARFNGQELPQRWFKFAVQQLIEEFLIPIGLESSPGPEIHEPVVEQILSQAASAPAVTLADLEAQEIFERAFARGSEDLVGKIADCDEALRLNPEYAEAYFYRGAARYARGDHGAAIADFDEVIRLDFQPADAYFCRGAARNAQGDLAGAIADYDEAIHVNPQDAEFYYGRGISRDDQGDLAGAIADYDEAIRLKPQRADAYTNRGVTRSRLGDLAGAIADFDGATRLDPQDAMAYKNRGIARSGQGDLAGAIADYDEAIRLNPQDAEVYYIRGVARNGQGDLAGAVADYDEAIRLNPQFVEAYHDRGVARSGQGDLAGAIADYDEAIRLNPQVAEVYYNRGIARRAHGDLDGAMADVESGARLAPEDVRFSLLRARIRVRTTLRRFIKRS